MPLGARTGVVAEGSQFRTDTERCFRMFALEGLRGASTRYHSHSEEEAVVAEDSRT